MSTIISRYVSLVWSGVLKTSKAFQLVFKLIVGVTPGSASCEITAQAWSTLLWHAHSSSSLQSPHPYQFLINSTNSRTWRIQYHHWFTLDLASDFQQLLLLNASRQPIKLSQYHQTQKPTHNGPFKIRSLYQALICTLFFVPNLI